MRFSGQTSGALALMARSIFTTEWQSQGVVIRQATETLNGPTHWGFSEDHHVIIVHEYGRLRSLISEFSNGFVSQELPAVGDLWVVPAGQDYHACAHGDAVGYFEFHVPVGRMRAAIVPTTAHNDQRLLAAARRLALLADHPGDLSLILYEQLVEAIRLHLLARHTNGIDESVIDYDRRFEQLEQHVRDTLEMPHSIMSMAKFTGLSKSSFIRKFYREFGQSPYQWLISLRLAVALQLLDQRDRSITEIAMDLGFASSSHFSTSFRQHYRLAPSNYRLRSGAS
jgi:AraC family transcriptional regulator